MRRVSVRDTGRKQTAGISAGSVTMETEIGVTRPRSTKEGLWPPEAENGNAWNCH